MRDLEVDVLKIEKLPFKTRDCKRLVQVEEKLFVLNGSSVHIIEDGNNVVAKSNATSIDFVELDNMVCMGDNATFECYKLDTDARTIITMSDGFLVHEWCPTDDRLALVNNKGILQVIQLIPHSSSYILIGQHVLDSDEPSPFIDIGWGSRSTQFNGSSGHTAEVCDITGTEILDDSYTIAWRSDGELFVVSFVRDSIRIFKVFTKNCEFCFESELTAGLCSQIAFKPTGYIIACEQRLNNENKILFFETNGLYRFNVRLTRNMDVTKIQWNQAGDILMVWQHDSEETHAVSDEISLWSCSNCNWSEKQSLVFNRGDEVNYVGWDDSCLQVITVKNLINYRWYWIVHQSIQNESLGETSEEAKKEAPLGAITVIAGSKLRVTITAEAMIPPPMCHYTIDFASQINYVVFGSASNIIAVVLNDYEVHIIELAETTYTRKSNYYICQKIRIPCTLNHFVYRESRSLLYCIEALLGGTSFVNKYTYNNVTVRESKCLLSAECITNLLRVHGPRGFGFHLALCKGELTTRYVTKPDSNKISKDLDLTDGSEVPSDRGGETSIHSVLDTFYVFSLFENTLYLNGKDTGLNFTSYLVWKRYIFFTSETTLYSVSLTESGIKQIISKELNESCQRPIPDGALLVTAIPGTRQIVLQVPRGDLEIVCPRVLAINEIDSLMAQGNYMLAYEIARTERINFNVFYDLNPPRFLANIESFITDINNCDYLVKFLAQLESSNITDELFGECLIDQPSSDSSDDKMGLIIEKMIEVMKNLNYDFYLQAIVAAYIRLDTDDAYDQAAREIWAGKTREQNTDMHISPDAILGHMIQEISVERMYEIALGLNNVELIMWVASKSNKDPGDYIPFLVDLSTMEPEYRLYKINRHIKRYEIALAHLINCDVVGEELTEFVEEEGLHVLLVKYASTDNQWYDIMMGLYKDFLVNNKHYTDAGYLCLKLSDYNLGLKMFLKSMLVQEYILCLLKLDLDDVETNFAIVEMKDRLIEKKRYKDASYIFECHLSNYEDAVAVLIQGRFWCDAQCLCEKYDRDDLLECEVLPNLLQYVEELNQTIISTQEDFISLKTRLRIVRQQRLHLLAPDQAFNNVGDVQLEAGRGDYELASNASTFRSRATTSRTRSTSSRMSTFTSKQAKRFERKKIEIREGSAFEDIAIVRKLHTLITEIQNLSETVTEACRTLLLLNNHYDTANDVQSAYEWTINYMHTSIDEIWPPEMLIPSNPLTFEAIALLHNIEHLDMQFRYPPPDLRDKWNKLLL